MVPQMALVHSFLWLSSIPLRGFAGGSVAKNPPANAGDRGSIPGLGIRAREGNGSQHQCSCLENLAWTEETGRLWSMELQRVGQD